MPHLDINNLSCSYGSQPVLDGLSLSVEKGQVVSLIGGSGSGKSTLLRVIMGLTQPTGGSISIGEQAVDYGSAASVRAAREKIAIVFQQYNLFNNMSVLRNVMVTPTRVQKRDERKVRDEAMTLLSKVGLKDKANVYPAQLSGGQQQRVAISRALALQPQILLLDEITSALDPELVGEVLDSVRQLARDGMTMLLVSHEMRFVREVSDQVAMMDKGRIVEMAPPEQLFTQPQQPRTQAFMQKVAWH
ncbi:amino acid ABC transporter ATP-binding protein [Pseudomonas typographi]|uniref:Amino acid ABC transporter ATP-binding protein n=1 Tax=Pseudomonas typographi TaxID=2715964 RepID=A0ABR7Z7N5_9PSED|nr:amino acid ABC transporter ATP-binding protein [Pseudomonas typographi]MBD1551112.1 amino acid ABC transporter ATP-binding protein [Pseudomonas typographi]MBD1586394.1 amino acid ABC transporter ATP-binding protein [Pseudomonas typographi]MBD1601353.1 amino acid ABC transporter ATP-binding protein [Pseudomonas typographi]